MKDTYAELDVGREVLELLPELLLKSSATCGVRAEVHESGRDNALLAAERAKDLGGELRASIRHGECRGASAVLSLDNLVAAILDAVSECLEAVLRKVCGEWDRRLREQRDDLQGRDDE